MSERFTPLKICFVQPVLSPYWKERLKVMAESDEIEVTLLLERGRFEHRPGWDIETIERVKCVVLNSAVISVIRNNEDLEYRIDGIRSFPWRLLTVLFRMRADVVVVCNATQTILALPSRLILRNRLALIVEDTLHATRHLGFWSKQVKKIMYRSADCCFAFSEDARRFLESIGIQSGHRSSWSLDMEEFRPQSCVPAICCAQRPSKEKIILFVGALIERKGVEILLESWMRLGSETQEENRLVIIGSGPLQERMERTIRDHNLTHVELRGQVPYQEVRQCMQNASLLVLPTLEDLFSLTVLEAMACGCPVITTPYAGAKELITAGENGWIVDPLKPGALTGALAHALSNQVNLRSMGAAARKRVEGMDNHVVMKRFAEDLIQLHPLRYRI